MLFGVEVIIWPLMTMMIIFTYFHIDRDGLIRDPLTDLVTRGTLDERVEVSIEKHKEFTLIMIDLDKFKPINDLYGHNEGDEALKITASILNSSVKNTDIVCRYGGDEFMIFIESSDSKVGELIIKRIESKFDEFNAKKIKEYEIHMSFGHVFIDKNNTRDIIQILGSVDELMYKEKKIRSSR